MGEITTYRDLEAWQVAMNVVVETYELTTAFPRSELYELTREMRRSAVSTPSNIAEGYVRGGRAELNHIQIGLGSSAELETQLEAAVRLSLVSTERAASLRRSIESQRRLLCGLRRTRRARLGISIAGSAVLLVLAIHWLA